MSEPTEAMRNLKDRIDTRLNDYLCEMKPRYDDSITGFNEAWDIVRKLFAEALALQPEAEQGRLWDRNRVCVAAGFASRKLQQWVPQHWLELFMDAYEAAEPAPPPKGQKP